MNEEKKMSPAEEAEEIREIFSALNESLPKLISGLVASVYNPETATSLASAIGKFYNKLQEEGIPSDLALEMTKKYVAGLDFGKILQMASSDTSGTKIILKKEKETKKSETGEEE